MLSTTQLHDLVSLVRLRYPGWDSFDHPPFVDDEIAVRRQGAGRAVELLGEAEMARLLTAGHYPELLARLEQLGQASNLLWRVVPRRGDLAILHDPRLDPAEFGQLLRRLLYGSGSSPERLNAFSDYLDRHGLPNRWPFPTYFLFLLHSESDYFVRPQVARWWLQYVGRPEAYAARPNSHTYQALLQSLDELASGLADYGPRDHIDLHGFIWVAMHESEARVGRLDLRGQVELDVPLADYESRSPARYLRENEGLYDEGRQAELDETEGSPLDDWTQPETGAPAALNEPYPLPRMAETTGLDEPLLARWVAALERKQQAIFYGPPGTGKTFVALELARHLVGGGDGFVQLLQFHPAYSYEEFMQGIRPHTTGDGRLTYKWVDGRFLAFCQQAAGRSGTCVLVLDELNRANLSRVFGELMYLLEYRDRSIQLASGRPFAVPGNVRIIGTMNTADRSIALVDHALRRRFAFIALRPNYELLRRFHQTTGYSAEPLIRVLQALNERIGDPDYAVGVTFFLRHDLAVTLADIWQMEIEPYLEEYFFDQPGQVTRFRWDNVAGDLAG